MEEQQQVSVEHLLKRLDRQSDILQSDKAAKSATTSTVSRRATGGSTRFGSAPGNDNEFVCELQAANVNPREIIMQKLMFYSQVINYVLPKSMEKRVAPKKLVMVAKTGLTVLAYYIRWLTDRNLLKSSIASEVRIIAKAIDAILNSEDGDIINQYPIELLMRRLYGFEQAFLKVFQEDDWRPPKTEAARKGWRSKIQWGMLELYDLQALEGEVTSLPDVDSEAQSVAETQRRFESYAETLNHLQPKENSAFPRAIGSTDGS